MIQGRRRPPQGPPQKQKPPGPLRDRWFAGSLLFGLGAGLIACLLLFLVPAVFFIEQNYNIFLQLAYDVKPGLVQHLEREILWIRSFLVLGSIATAAVGMLFARRLVRHLFRPLQAMEDHLQALTEGQWDQAPPDMMGEETYRSLFLNYEEFYRVQRANLEAELRLLESLPIDPQRRDALLAWQLLLSGHRGRLGLPALAPDAVNDDAASSSVSALSRRAS
ncbi:MAG: hypothetical protein KF802_12100 [Bdellovibrionaceae bacterium]|nr:hypothetical protein [Pseudobdellovibrionaceae bacterium]MBX3032857.1 hypothetical protein [Pseudobdellovibrionaceae bacterium]